MPYLLFCKDVVAAACSQLLELLIGLDEFCTSFLTDSLVNQNDNSTARIHKTDVTSFSSLAF